MFFAGVININNNKTEAILGQDINNKQIGYISNNDILKKIIKDIVSHSIEIIKDENNIINSKVIYINDEEYLMYLNNYLPLPWQILKIEKIDTEDLNNTLNIFSSLLDKEIDYGG